MCKFVEISNQMELNGEVWNFGYYTQQSIFEYFVHFSIEVKLAYNLEQSLLKLFFIFWYDI